MLAAVFDRAVVRAAGADAESYLQGQLSQDIGAIDIGSSSWSLVLQPSGKLTAWLRVHRVAEAEYLFDLDPSSVEDVVERLERFRLRTAVEFSVESGWEMLSIRGGEAPGVDGFIGEFRWPGFSGIDVVSADLAVPTLVTLDPDGFETGRITATVPRMGVDLDDETIPGEGGSAFIDMAVSFTKGCYTGQELVARIDSRGGNVPRPLRTLVGADPLEVGATVKFAGADVGVVTSASATVALARILRKVDPGETVVVAGVAAQVQPFPEGLSI